MPKYVVDVPLLNLEQICKICTSLFPSLPSQPFLYKKTHRKYDSPEEIKKSTYDVDIDEQKHTGKLVISIIINQKNNFSSQIDHSFFPVPFNITTLKYC